MKSGENQLPEQKLGVLSQKARKWSLGFRYAVHVCCNFVSGGAFTASIP